MPIVDARFDPREPFTRAEALAAGLTPWELRGDAYVRIHRNIYVSRRTPRTLAVRVRAALRAAPAGTVAAHHTAGLLWGGVVPPSPVIHVRIPHGETFDVAGIRTHVGVRGRAVSRRQGIPVTSSEQTFLDLAEDVDLVDLVVLGDSLVRHKASSPARLAQEAASWRGWGATTARRAASLVRAGVDSPPESRLRMLVVLAGLPEPTVNYIIRDPVTGEWLRRFELAYPELRLALEYEGRQHREDEIWAADIDRREDLDRRGWRIVQVISTGLYGNPLQTLQRVEQARLDRGAEPTPAFSEEWRRFFPGRESA